MKISELPNCIKKLALENIILQKQKGETENLGQAFSWKDTRQGVEFWGKLHDEKYISKINTKNKYQVNCKEITIDVYDVLNAFNVQNPAIQHAIKKLLKGGERGVKSKVQDYTEAIESINRAIELENN
jgi:hypothetical protein